jgi:hypothetical protein
MRARRETSLRVVDRVEMVKNWPSRRKCQTPVPQGRANGAGREPPPSIETSDVGGWRTTEPLYIKVAQRHQVVPASYMLTR